MPTLPNHGAARVTRGLVAAAVCTLLSVLGHVGAGGALPDTGPLVALGLPLAALMIALADRRRGPLAILALVGGSQLAQHGMLQVLGTHAHGSVEPVPMVAAHALAAVVTSVLLAGAESSVFLVAAALSRAAGAVSRLLPSVLPARSAEDARPAPLTRSVVVRPHGAPGRRLCPRRGPPVSGPAACAS